MTTTAAAIAAHEAKWADLPKIPHPPLPTPDGHPDPETTQAILNDLETIARLSRLITTAVTNGATVTLGPVQEYEIDDYLPPWPHDRAADMLTAWRNHTNQLPINQAGAHT